MSRRIVLASILIFLPSLGMAQSQFAGKWQTRTSPAGKSAITLNIALCDGAVSGDVVLLDLHGESKMPIVRGHTSGDVLEFETEGEDGAAWFWRLTLRSKRKGSLHGSIGEMLIDERVTKTR